MPDPSVQISSPGCEDLRVELKDFVLKYLQKRRRSPARENLENLGSDIFDSLFQIELILFLEKRLSLDLSQEIGQIPKFTDIESILLFIDRIRLGK